MSEGQSLLDLFAPPDKNRKGVFGLMCALSADRSFVKDALDNFAPPNERRQSGQCCLALFLDPHEKPITSLSGLKGADPSNKKQWPRLITYMHAKVALLGFGESAAGTPDYYRLIVSTGNWTRHAVNNEINLVWHCDYNGAVDATQAQEAADIREAALFWEVLLGLPTRNQAPDGDGGYYRLEGRVRARILKFLQEAEDRVAESVEKGTGPRFFSNLLSDKAGKSGVFFMKDSMGAQIVKKFGKDGIRRNSVICGSGFFEQADDNEVGSEPEVLKNIVVSLQGNSTLTDSIAPKSKWLVVNPRTSGAAGQWIRRPAKKSPLTWTPYRPQHPHAGSSRNLGDVAFHAKYILVANSRDYGYSSGLLYLGSGNLSKRGLALGPGTNGNVEAGVVIETARFDNEEDLCKSLGIDPGAELCASAIPEMPEGEETEHTSSELQVPPPILSCTWDPKMRLLAWEMDEGAVEQWTELRLLGQELTEGSTSLKLDHTEPSFHVTLRAKPKNGEKHQEWDIPVFKAGADSCCFYIPPATPKSGMRLIDAIASFPDVFSEDDEQDGEEDEEGNGNGTDDGSEGGGRTAAPGAREQFSDARDAADKYPLHFASALLEIIASQNQMVAPGQMPDYVAHLRRTLLDGMDKQVLKELAPLVEFLRPLLDKEGFKPPHSERQPGCQEYKRIINELLGAARSEDVLATAQQEY